MKDVLGREIRVGDIVVKGKHDSYAEINFARVVDILQKKVRLVPLTAEFLPYEDKWKNEPYVSWPDSILIINELYALKKVASDCFYSRNSLE